MIAFPWPSYLKEKGKSARTQATTAKKIYLFLPMANQCPPPLNCQARSNKEQFEFWSCKVWNWAYFSLLNLKNESVLCCPNQRVLYRQYRNWSPTANDPETANNPQNGPQMILDRKWSPKSTANDPERKIGMTWTQVSGSSCRFYYYYNKSD